MTNLVSRKMEYDTAKRNRAVVAVLSILCVCLLLFLWILWKKDIHC